MIYGTFLEWKSPWLHESKVLYDATYRPGVVVYMYRHRIIEIGSVTCALGRATNRIRSRVVAIYSVRMATA